MVFEQVQHRCFEDVVSLNPLSCVMDVMLYLFNCTGASTVPLLVFQPVQHRCYAVALYVASLISSMLRHR